MKILLPFSPRPIITNSMQRLRQLSRLVTHSDLQTRYFIRIVVSLDILPLICVGDLNVDLKKQFKK